jgi:hypothetical protein
MKAGWLACLSALPAVHAVCENLQVDINGNMVDWHDDGGPDFTCDIFYSNSKCILFGGSFPWGGMVAQMACCECGGGTEPTGIQCTPDESWIHPIYGDTCVDYYPGGKSVKFAASDKRAKKNCCVALDFRYPGLNTCADATLDGELWTDKQGASCAEFEENKNDDPRKDWCAKYGARATFANGGYLPEAACCTCGGGDRDVCTNNYMSNGKTWHDSGGEKYNCFYYEDNDLCVSDGDKYANDGMSANDACCACGGGSGGVAVETGEPQPDEGDFIYKGEFLLGTKFFQKKHLAGDTILYWNIDQDSKFITLGLLGPANRDGWISLGISPTGAMAGSDAVVGWLKEDGSFIMVDAHLENQSPNGVFEANMQDILATATMGRTIGRTAMVFTRPLLSQSGGVAIKPKSEFARIIYTYGEVAEKCFASGIEGMCNHQATERWRADVALVAPVGMMVTDLNMGGIGEPCQGPARLSCQEIYYCVHDQNADDLKEDFLTYGECRDLFEPDESDDEDVSGVQTVYALDQYGRFGGFENTTTLQGGFVLLWTMDLEKPGSLSPDDTITIALVSTLSRRNNGWIGYGWSPDGNMKGSDVVVGWTDEFDPDNTLIDDFFLEGQVASMNTPSRKQGLWNERVFRKNGQLVLTFSRKVYPADSVQLKLGDCPVIYAFGPLGDIENPEYIPYHRYRNKKEVTFVTDPNADTSGLMSENEICGNPEPLPFIDCKEGLICTLFPPELFEIDWSEAFEDTDGFTDSTDFATDTFSNMTALMGRGICTTAATAASFSDMDLSKLGEVQVLDPADWEYTTKLRWGVSLYYSYPDAESIRVAIVASVGPGWTSLGFSDDGMMIGSTAVVGWVDMSGVGNIDVQEYSLDNKLPWEVRPLPEGQTLLGVSNIEVINKGAENAVIYTRKLVTDKHTIVPGQVTTIVYAVGDTPDPVNDYFGYHRFRDSKAIVFERPRFQ